MLTHNRGFTLVEVLVAFSVICMLIVVILPINQTIQLERKKYYDKRVIAFKLHNQLLDYIYTNDIEKINSTEDVNQLVVHYTFERQERLIEGCAHWENVKKQEETICYYGFSRSQ